MEYRASRPGRKIMQILRVIHLVKVPGQIIVQQRQPEIHRVYGSARTALSHGLPAAQ